MSKYKNTILIVFAVILLVYAIFISIFPAILTSSFNIDKFEKQIFDATSLVTTVDTVEYKIKPNFDTIITFRNWSSKYIDDQDCFDATMIELTTTPATIFTNNIKIKQLYVKNAKFSNQLLPNGDLKIAFLPAAFNSKIFGKNQINIIAGPVRVKNFRIKNITPNDYKEDNRRESNYTEQEVKDFLSQMYFSSVNIK